MVDSAALDGMRRGAMVFCGLLGISAYAAAAEKQRPSDIFDQVAAGDSWTVVKTEPDGDVSRASDHVVSSKPVAAPCAGGANGGADAEAGTPMSWWELGCGVVLIGWVPGLIGYKILRLLGDTIHDVRVTWRRSAKSSLRLTVKRVAASVESLVDKPS